MPKHIPAPVPEGVTTTSSSTSTSAFKHKLQQHSAYTFCSAVQDMRQNNRTNTYPNTIY